MTPSDVDVDNVMKRVVFAIAIVGIVFAAVGGLLLFAEEAGLNADPYANVIVVAKPAFSVKTQGRL